MHRQLTSLKPSWWLNSAPTIEGLMKASLRHCCLGPYTAVLRRVECELPSPATEAVFQGKLVLATWVTLGPSFSCPLVDSGGPLAGKADAMLPTDGLSALPVSPRLLLMSQGEDFFLLHVWFVTLSIYTL